MKMQLVNMYQPIHAFSLPIYSTCVEDISSIYILYIISSLSFTYNHTDYILISDHVHIG